MADDKQQPAPESKEQADPPKTESDPKPEYNGEFPDPSLDDERVPEPPKLNSSRKGLKVILVVILVLGIAAIVGWLFFMRDSGTSTDAPTEQAAPASETSSGDVPEAENTESFTSDPYRLTFKHPSTWTVTENNDNSILIQSEDFTYQTASGESKNGNFRVFVRKGGQQVDSDIIEKGVAIEPSRTLTYTNPTAAQRAETNLTLFGQDNTDNFAFMLITSNFELQTGDTLGPDFGQEIEAFIIGGGFSESGLEPGLATNPVPKDNFQNTNAYKQAVAIIASFEIQ